jgi:hypothetical protein
LFCVFLFSVIDVILLVITATWPSRSCVRIFVLITVCSVHILFRLIVFVSSIAFLIRIINLDCTFRVIFFCIWTRPVKCSFPIFICSSIVVLRLANVRLLCLSFIVIFITILLFVSIELIIIVCILCSSR